MGNICLVSPHYSHYHHIHIIYPDLLPFVEDVEVPKTKRELYHNHLLNLRNRGLTYDRSYYHDTFDFQEFFETRFKQFITNPF